MGEFTEDDRVVAGAVLTTVGSPRLSLSLTSLNRTSIRFRCGTIKKTVAHSKKTNPTALHAGPSRQRDCGCHRLQVLSAGSREKKMPLFQAEVHSDSLREAVLLAVLCERDDISAVPRLVLSAVPSVSTIN